MHSASPTETKAATLTLSGVSLLIDHKRLLSDLTISLPITGITAIMGYNGSGKSLFVKCLHGIITTYTGLISWLDTNNNATTTPQQAMVFQKPTPLRRTVAANVAYALKIAALNTGGQGANPTRQSALLESVGLLHKKDVPARLLSGGEQQRLALACALASEPKVLFLDEATASLDPASTAIIEQLVSQCAENGMAVIMVTHDAAQAARLANRIVFMHNGQIVEHANTKQFLNDPTSKVAQAYLSGALFNDHEYESINA